MRGDRLRALARRALVLAATIGVVALAAVTVQAASLWRTEAAVLDPHPVDAAAISDAATAEAGRTADLEAQLAAVTGQVSDLQAALAEAGATVDADAADATATRNQLARATTKLGTVQAQLRAAQARLAALDRAASDPACCPATPARVTA